MQLRRLPPALLNAAINSSLLCGATGVCVELPDSTSPEVGSAVSDSAAGAALSEAATVSLTDSLPELVSGVSSPPQAASENTSIAESPNAKSFIIRLLIPYTPLRF